MDNTFTQPPPASQGNLSGVLAVGVCGLLSSFLVAIILSAIELNEGPALYSFMLWFIVPAGAIGAGFLAAGGYYLGSKIFHHRPGTKSFIWVVLVSILTFFLINFLNYYFLEIDGYYVREDVSFFSYLDFVTTHTVIEYSHRGSNSGNTGELGKWGYGFAALQILGFSGGGLWICSILRGQVFCEKCRRYFRRKRKITLKSSNQEKVMAHVEAMRVLFDENRFDDAIVLHRAFDATSRLKGKYIISLIVHECPVCREHRILFDVKERLGNEWKSIPGAACHGVTSEVLQI